MTFNPNIPQPKDIMSDSQGDLLTNNTQLNVYFGTSGDHVALNATSSLGRHTKVRFLSQGSSSSDAPTTLENEIALFSLEDGTDTEVYLRQEKSGAVTQVTKDGELYVGAHPVFAINISDLTPNSNTTPGPANYNFTVNSSYNLDTATTQRLTASRAHYRFGFTNGVVDSAGMATNKYLFYANGFDNSSNIVLGKVPNTATYGNEVNTSYIDIEFVNQNNTKLTSLTGATVICWRVQ